MLKNVDVLYYSIRIPQCTNSAGSKPAPEHDAATTMSKTRVSSDSSLLQTALFLIDVVSCILDCESVGFGAEAQSMAMTHSTIDGTSAAFQYMPALCFDGTWVSFS